MAASGAPRVLERLTKQARVGMNVVQTLLRLQLGTVTCTRAGQPHFWQREEGSFFSLFSFGMSKTIKVADAAWRRGGGGGLLPRVRGWPGWCGSQGLGVAMHAARGEPDAGGDDAPGRGRREHQARPV